MKRFFLFALVVFNLLTFQAQVYASDLELDGKIHTRVSYIDLGFEFREGGSKYSDEVTIVEIGANVQIWNTGTSPQKIGFHWYAPYCGNYLHVITNITDEVLIYDGTPIYQTTCSLEEKFYDPGLTEENALIYLVFDSVNLPVLPSGEYYITAPTKNGTAYTTTIYSDDGTVSYNMEEIPDNWGDSKASNIYTTTLGCTGVDCGANHESGESEGETLAIPISTPNFIAAFVVLSIVRFFETKRRI